jgi:CubicO group peptidase (beta-lactamase class C family)
MKRLLLLASLFLALPAHAQSDADGVTAFLKAKMRQERIPALQVAVIRHGKIVKNAAYGVATAMRPIILAS